MKGIVRIAVLLLVAIALPGMRGADAVSGISASELAETGISSPASAQESLIFPENQDDGILRRRLPALNDGGVAFSAARTISEASRERNFSKERNNCSQHLRSGFSRNGRTICSTRVCGFIFGSVAIPGFLSGLSPTVSLKRLRI